MVAITDFHIEIPEDKIVFIAEKSADSLYRISYADYSAAMEKLLNRRDSRSKASGSERRGQK